MSILRSLFGRKRKSPNEGMELRVLETIRETVDATTIRFVPVDGSVLGYAAGQFLTFTFEIDGREHRRSYSFSSAPGETPAITVKRVEGGVVSTHLVERVRFGTLLRAAGPFGSFTPRGADDVDEWVFVAGGSGITPIMSMLSSTAGSFARCELLYGNRSLADVIFRRRLDAWAERGLRVRHFLETPPVGFRCERGRLDGEALLRHVDNVDRKRFFVCGPAPMMASAVAALRSAGVSTDRIRTEQFTKPRIESTGPGHPIRFLRSARTATAGPDESLLSAGLAAGIGLDYACEMGECGTCRLRLVEGAVDAPATSGLTVEERNEGYVLACVSRPKCPITVDA